MSETTYIRNRETILNRAREYYKNGEERLRERERERERERGTERQRAESKYRELPEEEKNEKKGIWQK